MKLADYRRIDFSAHGEEIRVASLSFKHRASLHKAQAGAQGGVRLGQFKG